MANSRIVLPPISSFTFFLANLPMLFLGKPKWTPDHLPDLSSKVVIVTGGNTGIGRETVKRLLLKNAKVYLAARSEEKAERAIEELREETGKNALFLHLDLGDLNSIKKAAEDYRQRESQLDVLFLNAGVLYPPIDQLTAQGYDATFGTNVIGHFLLMKLLYPILAASSREDNASRIVWLASMSHYKSRGITYDAYQDGPVRRRMDGFDLYAESKLAAVMLAAFMGRNCVKDNVVAISVDPGNIKSEIYRDPGLWFLKLYASLVINRNAPAGSTHGSLQDILFSFPVEYGAVTPLYAGCAPEAAAHNGKYLRPWARLGTPNTVALNVEEQQKLWNWLEERVQPFL